MSSNSSFGGIETLNLSKRAYRLLLDAGIREISKIEELTDEELIRQAYLDIKSLQEIRGTIREQQQLVPINKQSAYGISINVLGLSARTYNALKRHGFGTLGDALLVLSEFKARGESTVRNLGPHGIHDLQEAVDRYFSANNIDSNINTNSSTPSLLTSTTTNETPKSNEQWSDLIREFQKDLKLGRLHLRARIEGRSLKTWIRQHATQSDESVFERAYFRSRHVLQFRTICAEVERLFHNIPADRIEIFVNRYGTKRQTLDQLGKQRNLTRERIRQITNKVSEKINEALTHNSNIRILSALAIAEDMGDSITYKGWLRTITRTGLLGNWSTEAKSKFQKPPGEILLALCNYCDTLPNLRFYALPTNLRLVVGQEAISAKAVAIIQKLTKEDIRFIRRQVRNTGAIYTPVVSEKLHLFIDDARSILLGLGYKPVAQDWYTIENRQTNKPKRSWAVFHVVLKIIRYCGPLEINEICNGLRRHMSRHGYSVPPPAILEHVLLTNGFQIQNSHLVWPYENNCVASTSEKIFIQEIQRLGPVINFFELVEAFTKSGLSIPALSVVLRYSPLITRMKIGYYTLRGAFHSLVDYEKARHRQPVTIADPETTYEITGQIRFRINLGSVAISSGVITGQLPVSSGKWALFVDETECGVVKISDNQMWGLGKAIKKLNLQIGTRIEMLFDTWKQQVHMMALSNELE